MNGDLRSFPSKTNGGFAYDFIFYEWGNAL